MYLSLRAGNSATVERANQPGIPADEPGAGGTVVALGITSFFTDISSEMVVAILPLYLTTRIGFGIDEFGLFDGIFAAATVALLLVGGVLSDRWQRHKTVAVGGYALSTLSRFGLLVAASPVLFLISDRVGKGLRSAPRDALISLHAPKDRLAASFGLHRTFDTAGALIGPFAAWLLLRWLPGDYQTIFLVSLVAGIAGVVTISVAVPSDRLAKPMQATHIARDETISTATASSGTSQINRLAACAALLGAGTISDGLLYLALFKAWDFDPSLFPLLFAATSTVYLLLAVPMGALADRIGKVRLLLPAQLVLLAVYALVLWGRGSGAWIIWVILGLHGVYYAMTDGIYPALASAITPFGARGRGIGTVGFGNAMGRLIAAACFGLLWSAVDLGTAVACFMLVLTVLTLFARQGLRPLQAAGI